MRNCPRDEDETQSVPCALTHTDIKEQSTTRVLIISIWKMTLDTLAGLHTVVDASITWLRRAPIRQKYVTMINSISGLALTLTVVMDVCHEAKNRRLTLLWFLSFYHSNLPHGSTSVPVVAVWLMPRILPLLLWASLKPRLTRNRMLCRNSLIKRYTTANKNTPNFLSPKINDCLKKRDK